ncbi:unnamed protein product [Ilex paraguariensis]|uniref:Uncharacterized protein n=1 Tax=Ilex paraguariensis TaxID=185542 RepID=A0ABC8R474_9AQUA
MLSILPQANILKSAALGANDEATNASSWSCLALKDKLKLREAKLDKIVRAINYAKLEKEAAELKLKLVELESTMAATDQIIKDLKSKCIMNYAKGCEDFRD